MLPSAPCSGWSHHTLKPLGAGTRGTGYIMPVTNMIHPDNRDHADRQSHGQPAHVLMLEQSPGVVPKSLLGKGLTYLREQWPKLIRYVENGSWPIYQQQSLRKCDSPILRWAPRMAVLGHRRRRERVCQPLYASRDQQDKRNRPIPIPRLAVPASSAGKDRRRLRRAASLEDAGRHSCGSIRQRALDHRS